MPVVWPDGKYGLPKSKLGCPDTAGLNFTSGWRKHDTEDYNSNNFFSSPLNLAGWFNKNDLQHEFCIKEVHTASHQYHTSTWPQGFYCIYKHGNCPIGFTESELYWHDEEYHNKNEAGGTLPDGVYNKDTWIYYCCRNDEPRGSTWPIDLPTGHPFYLIRSGGYCQVVRGMEVSEEWIRWDDEDNDENFIDKRKGYITPDDTGGNKDHFLHFCYYYN